MMYLTFLKGNIEVLNALVFKYSVHNTMYARTINHRCQWQQKLENPKTRRSLLLLTLQLCACLLLDPVLQNMGERDYLQSSSIKMAVNSGITKREKN